MVKAASATDGVATVTDAVAVLPPTAAIDAVAVLPPTAATVAELPPTAATDAVAVLLPTTASDAVAVPLPTAAVTGAVSTATAAFQPPPFRYGSRDLLDLVLGHVW